MSILMGLLGIAVILNTINICLLNKRITDLEVKVFGDEVVSLHDNITNLYEKLIRKIKGENNEK